MNYKKIGEGSFGCVINQPLCSKYKTKKGMITKLIRKTKNNNYVNELKLSKKLKESKLFCTIEDHCILKHSEIPISVRYDDLRLNKKKCSITRIDPKESKKIKYISFLMPYCGKPLTSDTIQFLLKNEFTNFIKKLLNGLVYCKKNKIVLGDIKMDNILIKNKTPFFIDFGNAQIISIEKKLHKNISELSSSPGFTSPELMIYKCILDDIDDEESDNLCDICFKKKEVLAIYKCLNSKKYMCQKHAKKLKKQCNPVKLKSYVDSLKQKITSKDVMTKVKEDIDLFNESLDELSDKDIKNHLTDYYALFKNNQFCKNFITNFRTDYIYKTDIYSLGRVFETIYDKKKIKNSNIKKLITNMITLNHEKRFSIEDCINYMS